MAILKVKKMQRLIGNKILVRSIVTFITVFLFNSCGKTYIEKSRDEYSPEDVDPIVFSVTGPSTVYQTDTRDYEIGYSRAGSSWSWSVEGAELAGISEDTKRASVFFRDKPSNDTVYLTVSETTSGGVKSPDTVIKVKVIEFCVLEIQNFTGLFDCNESGYHTYQVNFRKDPVLSNTILNDNFWDWPGPGQVVRYTLSGDFLETVTVPKQTFIFGDGITGWVEGSGTYKGCSHTMVVDYTVFYDGNLYQTHHEFSPAVK
ncbi:MAG: hypothetical protein HPY62_08295 [Bacteroidales bacterium]|nr:hypothetical protein [Bacteroidales bacterium]